MRPTRRHLLAGLALGAAAPALAAALPASDSAADASTAGLPAATRLTAALPSRVFGRSVQGRALTVATLGDPEAAKRVLVVGVIHGNEQAGLKVLRLLKNSSLPTGVSLWLVDAVNPDGQHLDTRQNARGVDLNRNFPTRWKHYGKPHDVYYPGPRAVSEPETRATMGLIASLRPDVTIYYHQHLDVVDLAGGSEAIERSYAHRVGMLPEQLTRYGGSACTWADSVYRAGTAFCVELPATVSSATAARHAAAVLALAADQAALAPSVAATPSPSDSVTPAPAASMPAVSGSPAVS